MVCSPKGFLILICLQLIWNRSEFALEILEQSSPSYLRWIDNKVLRETSFLDCVEWMRGALVCKNSFSTTLTSSGFLYPNVTTWKLWPWCIWVLILINPAFYYISCMSSKYNIYLLSDTLGPTLVWHFGNTIDQMCSSKPWTKVLALQDNMVPIDVIANNLLLAYESLG